MLILETVYLFFGQAIPGRTFFEFMAMRIGTLFIDNGGMYLMLNWNWNDLAAKCIVNFIIIALNYILSKLLIFKNKKVESE